MVASIAQKRERVRGLPDQLRRVILGQEQAVRLVAERVQHGEFGLTKPDRVRASFLFLGPTGVGKTELCLRFSEAVFGPDKVVRFDMSEYQTPERLGLLLGTSADDPGRIAEGYDACGGSGTLLFDEIEKAHPRVLNILLQILDAARVTTGRNRVLNFSSWYAVLTSNIGAQRIMAMRKSKYETMERLVRADAQRELSPELFARITETVVFNKLSYDVQREVAAAMLETELRDQKARGYFLEADPSVLEVVVQQGYDDRLGARPMRRALERLVRNALTEDLCRGGRGAGRLQVHPGGAKLELLPSATAAAA